MSFLRYRKEVITCRAGRWPRVSLLPRVATALVLALSASLATAADGWLSNYDEAMAAAERTGRPVLTIFTGSDWCPHCRTLEHNVLQTDTFLAWASDRVVLLMIDLPQQGISTEERRARSKVCIRYGVRVFPSALLIAPDGSKIALQTGYTGQTATTWVAAIGSHLPEMPDTPGRDAVFSTIHDAVATSRTARKPVLVMVSRAGDENATTAVNSLIRDPEFEALARDNFVVAAVPQSVEAEPTEQVGQLLGGADLPDDGVEIIVTEDGHTPLFTQSGSEPPHRVVTGLRRFLAARKTHRW
jgi:thiol-disulfide isomerase/thioredoxin